MSCFSRRSPARLPETSTYTVSHVVRRQKRGEYQPGTLYVCTTHATGRSANAHTCYRRGLLSEMPFVVYNVRHAIVLSLPKRSSRQLLF